MTANIALLKVFYMKCQLISELENESENCVAKSEIVNETTSNDGKFNYLSKGYRVKCNVYNNIFEMILLQDDHFL